MSDKKKDLTRIEDLGEFIHELNGDDDSTEDAFGSSELPDLPSEDADPFGSDDDSFSTSEEDPFASTEEDPFTTNESVDSGSFDTSDFTTSFETSEFSDSELPDLTTTETTSEPVLEATPVDEFSRTDDENFLADLDESPSIISQVEETSTPVFEKEEIYIPSGTYKAPENFEDVKKFAESSSFTGMGAEGNPSFSLLIKNVRYIEDVNDILTLLKELKLLADTEEQVKSRLTRGTLLIPRISEYAAIFLAHKLRRFDIDIQVGLSDEIHPPKHQETPEVGLVSKASLYQNQTHHFHFDDPKLEISQIIIAATSTLDGYQVLRYLGVASEHKMLDSDVVENEDSEDIPRHYQELAQKLKAHALKANANAVVGLNYQLTPIPSELGLSGHKYRLTCTGNLVWVNKL